MLLYIEVISLVVNIPPFFVNFLYGQGMRQAFSFCAIFDIKFNGIYRIDIVRVTKF